MTTTADPELDLTISRIIRAPRNAVWSAWADPQNFEKWWVPAPAKCRVKTMDLEAGGGLETLISETGEAFSPHLRGCFLEVVEGKRIVFTNALLAGWRPAEQPFMTAIITFEDHPEGTSYSAQVMHRTGADRDMHETMGFYDGWGTVIEQLAVLVERAE